MGKQGFASMDPQKQRLIAAKGGIMAHIKGTAHEWTSASGRTAGQLGGVASAKARKLRKEAEALSNMQDVNAIE